MAYDFKKEFKELYKPSCKPVSVNIVCTVFANLSRQADQRICAARANVSSPGSACRRPCYSSLLFSAGRSFSLYDLPVIFIMLQ